MGNCKSEPNKVIQPNQSNQSAGPSNQSAGASNHSGQPNKSGQSTKDNNGYVRDSVHFFS